MHLQTPANFVGLTFPPHSSLAAIFSSCVRVAHALHVFIVPTGRGRDEFSAG